MHKLFITMIWRITTSWKCWHQIITLKQYVRNTIPTTIRFNTIVFFLPHDYLEIFPRQLWLHWYSVFSLYRRSILWPALSIFHPFCWWLKLLYYYNKSPESVKQCNNKSVYDFNCCYNAKYSLDSTVKLILSMRYRL